MHTAVLKKITDLKLDLHNFRTLPQKNEEEAVAAMITINPDYFWGLMDSLLQDYLPTDNIIILKNDKSELIVKEGNRRVAALKLILGKLKGTHISIPVDKVEKIKNITQAWKNNNSEVPCLIYEQSEAAIVDKIISLTHGKGEKAGRDKWTAVATARHSRDVNKASEPALDLLEKFLKKSKTITGEQKERWAGDYPLTVLNEGMQKLSARLGFADSVALAKAYPKVTHVSSLESIITDIGHGHLVTRKMRDKNEDFALKYGIPPLPSSTNGGKGSTGSGSGTGGGTGTGGSAGSSAGTSTGAGTSTATTAYSLNDPKSVKQVLDKFTVVGTNRSKVVTLRIEMQKINITSNPIAFCFLLRSSFEISSKAYCLDNNISTTKLKKGTNVDLTLAETLSAITTDLKNKNTADKHYAKKLSGANTEIAKKDGVLSITSMNQLVHNPIYTISVGDLCALFHKIFPLLQEMNK